MCMKCKFAMLLVMTLAYLPPVYHVVVVLKVASIVLFILALNLASQHIACSALIPGTLSPHHSCAISR